MDDNKLIESLIETSTDPKVILPVITAVFKDANIDTLYDLLIKYVKAHLSKESFEAQKLTWDYYKTIWPTEDIVQSICSYISKFIIAKEKEVVPDQKKPGWGKVIIK
jgi:hypothetical protein